MKLPTAAVLTLTVAALLAGCDARPNLDDADAFGPLDWWVAPTQGRPALRKVGGRLPVLYRMPAGFDGEVTFRLHDAADAGDSMTLKPEADPAVLDAPPPGPLAIDAAPAGEGERLISASLKIPDDARPGLYDLAVTARGGAARTRVLPRAVALYAEFPEQFRFAQLSNMNVGNVTAPDFSDELVREVNLLAPEFIITTGDYTEWSAVRGDADSWFRVKRYFARFDAPVFLVAGDHDHVPSFRTHVAAARMGRFSFGDVNGILLHDTYTNPIDQDTAQTLWLDDTLKATAADRLTFLVSSSDSLRVLDAWRKLGFDPGDYARRRRVGMIFVGGYSDWDGIEHAGKLAGTGVAYVRTHESSTCIRGKATGTPHYRIVEVDGNAVRYRAPADGPAGRGIPSAAVGSVTVHADPPDGSARRVKLTVVNRLNVPLVDLRAKVLLKGGLGPVQAAGGRVERIIDRGDKREVWLRVDCPDRGSASAVVRTAGALPDPPAGLEVSFIGDPVLIYRQARSADGFGYYATGGEVMLRIINRGDRPRNLWPAVRLAGNLLSFKGVPMDQPVTVAPGQERVLPLRLELGLASPGDHWLTVHLRDDPLPHILARKVIQMTVE